MKIRVTSIVWIAFALLSVLMGGGIGRSYMWLIACVVIFFLLVYEGTNSVKLNILVKKYGVFIIYCSIVTFVNFVVSGLEPNIYIKSQLIEMMILAFGASYLSAYYAKTESIVLIVRRISWILLIAGIIEEITRFNVTKYLWNYKYVSQYLINDGRVMSIFSHPIGYAIVLSFIFLLAIYYPYQSTIKQTTYIILILLNLLCTKTRMAMIAVAFLGFVYLVRSGKAREWFNGKMKYKKNSLIYLLCLAAIIAVIVTLFHERVMSFMDSILYRLVQMFTGKEQGIRLGVIANYFANLEENSWMEIIFGKGTGYSSVYMIENPIYYWNSAGEKVAWTETTDNMYISILMNYGLIGLILFFNIFYSAIKKMIARTSRSMIIGASGLMALFFDLFFFEGLFWPVIMNIMGTYMAFITKNESNEMC